MPRIADGCEVAAMFEPVPLQAASPSRSVLAVEAALNRAVSVVEKVHAYAATRLATSRDVREACEALNPDPGPGPSPF